MIDQTGDQGSLGTDHDKIDMFVAAELQHGVEIQRIDRGELRHLADAGIARGADQLVDQRRGGKRPAQGVFTPARPDDENIHIRLPVKIGGRKHTDWSRAGNLCIMAPVDSRFPDDRFGPR